MQTTLALKCALTRASPARTLYEASFLFRTGYGLGLPPPWSLVKRDIMKHMKFLLCTTIAYRITTERYLLAAG